MDDALRDRRLPYTEFLTSRPSSAGPSLVGGVMGNKWGSRAAAFKYLEPKNAKPGALSIQGGKTLSKVQNHPI